MFVFFFNDTATTEIYTLSLHDALPISLGDVEQHHRVGGHQVRRLVLDDRLLVLAHVVKARGLLVVLLGLLRSEEHTSELQSRQYLVCRLLLEKKKKTISHLLTSSSLHT